MHMHTGPGSTTQFFSRQELVNSLMRRETITGLISVNGQPNKVSGVVNSIEANDGSGHSFNVVISTQGGNVSGCLRTRD